MRAPGYPAVLQSRKALAGNEAQTPHTGARRRHRLLAQPRPPCLAQQDLADSPKRAGSKLNKPTNRGAPLTQPAGTDTPTDSVPQQAQ